MGRSCAYSRRRWPVGVAGTAQPAPLVRPGPRVAYVGEGRASREWSPLAERVVEALCSPRLIAECVHCGFCLPTCPTYALWHEEMDSPRGRIYLMAGLVDGSIWLSDTVVEHFDRCLGCMACVTSCPSGVQYDRLIELDARLRGDEHTRRGGERLCAGWSSGSFRTPGGCAQRSRFRSLPRPASLRALHRDRAAVAHPAVPPEHPPGDGPEGRLRSTGCVQSVVFGDVNAATARVLAADGYDVHVPRGQGCCGALARPRRRLDEGWPSARAREALAATTTIVTNAAGCGSHLKDHVHPFAKVATSRSCSPGATRWPSGIRFRFASRSRTRAISLHAQRHRAEPRSARAIPGLERSSPRNRRSAAAAPGSTTSSSPTRPVSSASARQRTSRHRARTRTRAGIPAACPGDRGASPLGPSAPAFHPIELVDASIRGVDVGCAARLRRAAERGLLRLTRV